MKFSSADLSTILNRILDTAADNLRVAKILIQLGLDPDNITYDAIFNRLLEIVLANITLANMFALVGAIFFVATLLTQTMVPLRIANMVGCAFFAGFGALAGNVSTFLLYLLLLPINAFRLRRLFSCICCCSRSMRFACGKCSPSSRRHVPQPRAIRRWNGSNRL